MSVVRPKMEFVDLYCDITIDTIRFDIFDTL
jgi:hypothetical protein